MKPAPESLKEKEMRLMFEWAQRRLDVSTLEVNKGYDSPSEALGATFLPIAQFGVKVLLWLWKLPDRYNEALIRILCKKAIWWAKKRELKKRWEKMYIGYEAEPTQQRLDAFCQSLAGSVERERQWWDTAFDSMQFFNENYDPDNPEIFRQKAIERMGRRFQDENNKT